MYITWYKNVIWCQPTMMCLSGIGLSVTMHSRRIFLMEMSYGCEKNFYYILSMGRSDFLFMGYFIVSLNLFYI